VKDGLTKPASILRFMPGLYGRLFSRRLGSMGGNRATIAFDLPSGIGRDGVKHFPWHAMFSLSF
jgi:hypothetical protein